VHCPRCQQRLQVPTPPQPLPPPAANKTVLGILPDTMSQPLLRREEPPPFPTKRFVQTTAFPPDPDAAPNRDVAVTVVGIVSCSFYLIFLILFWPAMVVSLVMGPIAWVMGSADLKGIRAGELQVEGKSFVLVGYICGIVSTILAIVTLVTCLL